MPRFLFLFFSSLPPYLFGDSPPLPEGYAGDFRDAGLTDEDVAVGENIHVVVHASRRKV